MLIDWKKKSCTLSIVIQLWLVLAACAGPTQMPPVGGSPAPRETGTPDKVPSPEPTLPSPTVASSPASSPTRIILISAEQSPTDLHQSIQTTITRLAAEEGLILEVRTALEPASLTPDTSMVIFVSRTNGGEASNAAPGDDAELITKMAASHPGIQFLAIGVSGLGAQGNISMIDLQASTPPYMGFLAGYLSAVVTNEWRVGSITTDDAEGMAFRQGFLNGVVFYCGLCQPTYPPFSGYPLAASLPQNSTSAEWQAAAAALIERGVKTVYLAPGAGDASLVEFLAQLGVGLIGSAAPPGSEVQWIATISTDIPAVLETIWDELVSGHGGLSISPPLKLTNIDEEVLTPGRQRLIEGLIQEIQDGFVDPGVENPSATP